MWLDNMIRTTTSLQETEVLFSVSTAAQFDYLSTSLTFPLLYQKCSEMWLVYHWTTSLHWSGFRIFLGFLSSCLEYLPESSSSSSSLSAFLAVPFLTGAALAGVAFFTTLGGGVCKFKENILISLLFKYLAYQKLLIYILISFHIKYTVPLPPHHCCPLHLIPPPLLLGEVGLFSSELPVYLLPTRGQK